MVQCKFLFIRIVEMSVTTSRRRVSYAQLEALCEFLNTHRDIAMGYNKSAQAREDMRKLWTRVTETLNAFGEGAFKDWKGWAAYWVDYKGKLKRKCAALRTSQSRTGGGPSEVPELSDIEKKYLMILGVDFGAGLPGVQVDPFPGSDNNTSEGSPSIMVALSLPSTQIQLVENEGGEGSARRIEEVPQNSDAAVNTEPRVPTPDPGPTRRRQQRRTPPFTQEAARRTLVRLSQQRVEIESNNSQILAGIERVLNRIADTLERMERK